MEVLDDFLISEQQPRRTHKRLWCAMVSAVMPGLGDWILGNKKVGGAFLGFFFFQLFCYWPLRLPRFYWPFILLVFAGLLLHVISGCCTFLVRRSVMDAAANWWILVVIAVALFSVSLERRLELRASGFQVFTVPSDSMAPTINPGDYVVADMWSFRDRRPEAGEVVVFRHRALDLIKRIAAKGGDIVTGANGRIEVNGQLLVEPYIVHRDVDHPQDERDNFGPFRLSKDEIFVMGDNRDYSLDSRIRSGEYDYGPVFETDVISKPLYHFRGSVRGSSYDGQLIK
jgi:signal peptidase I